MPAIMDRHNITASQAEDLIARMVESNVTRYDKLGANFFAFIQLASIRIFLRSIESTP